MWLHRAEIQHRKAAANQKLHHREANDINGAYSARDMIVDFEKDHELQINIHKFNGKIVSEHKKDASADILIDKPKIKISEVKMEDDHYHTIPKVDKWDLLKRQNTERIPHDQTPKLANTHVDGSDSSPGGIPPQPKKTYDTSLSQKWTKVTQFSFSRLLQQIDSKITGLKSEFIDSSGNSRDPSKTRKDKSSKTKSTLNKSSTFVVSPDYSDNQISSAFQRPKESIMEYSDLTTKSSAPK